MAKSEPRWALPVQMLLHGLYLPVIGLVILLEVWRAYDALPAEGVLSALHALILLIPAAAMAATALRSRWQWRLIVLAVPYVWLMGVLLVWAVAGGMR